MSTISTRLKALHCQHGTMVLVALILLPLVVFGIRDLLEPQIRSLPVDDGAVIELELAQVPEHWPTKGAYSRFEFHHPGPAGHYLILPWYLLGHQHSAAINLGALMVNLLFLMVTLLLLRPWSTRGLLVGLLMAMLTFRYLSSAVMTTPWGPYLCLAPLLAMFALMARFSRNEPSSWILAALIGGILVQLHVLFVPVCGLLVLVGLLLPSGEGIRLGRVWLWGTAGLTLLLWFPILVDLTHGEQSNAMDLFRFFQKPFVLEDPSQRFLLGAQSITAFPLTIAHTMPAAFPGLAHNNWQPAAPSGIWIALISQFVLAGWLVVSLSRKGTHSPAFRLTIASIVILIWGVFSVLRIRGLVLPYIMTWLTIPTVILWGLSIWHGLNMVWDRTKIRIITTTAGLVVSGFVFTALLGEDLALRNKLPRARGLTVATISTQIIEQIPNVKASGVHIVRADKNLWGIITGLILQLKKAGVDATVCHDFGLMVPPSYLNSLPDKPALCLTRDDKDGNDLPLLIEVDGIQVRRLFEEESGAIRMAFGPGWGTKEKWGRWLRELEGQIVAECPGSATLLLEVTMGKGMTEGQNLTIFENDREIWSDFIGGKAWKWSSLEIPLSVITIDNQRDIRFVCERAYPMPGSRVRPMVLGIRNLRIVAGG